jgi:hypothetical protein
MSSAAMIVAPMSSADSLSGLLRPTLPPKSALMALLFAAGVMNLFWVGAIALFVPAEKPAPRGARLGRAAGILRIAWGAWVLVR